LFLQKGVTPREKSRKISSYATISIAIKSSFQGTLMMSSAFFLIFLKNIQNLISENNSFWEFPQCSSPPPLEIFYALESPEKPA